MTNKIQLLFFFFLNIKFQYCFGRSKRTAHSERGDLEHCANHKEQQDHRPEQDPKDLQGEKLKKRKFLKKSEIQIHPFIQMCSKA